jgi:hypothetical protein
LVVINGFMALLIVHSLDHTTGVCTGSGAACSAIFLAEAGSRRLHIIVESLIWGVADFGFCSAWVSTRRDRRQLERIANIGKHASLRTSE